MIYNFGKFRLMKNTSSAPAAHFPLGQRDYKPDSVGDFRRVELNGRAGLLAESVHSRLRFDRHTLNEARGALTFWVASRDALRSWAAVPWSNAIEANPHEYVFLAEETDAGAIKAPGARGWKPAGPLRNSKEAAFSLVWNAGWYPQFFAKWCRGLIYGGDPAEGESNVFSSQRPTSLAFVAAGHWHVVPQQWYQIGLSWDAESFDYRLYLNGVLVSVSNRFDGAPPESCKPTLVAGNTNFALSDLAFYDEALSADAMADLYRAEVISPNPEIDAELRKTYAGEPVERFDFKPDSSWKTQLKLSLCEPDAMEHFQVQGFDHDSIQAEADGLRIATHLEFQKSSEGLQRSQGYLWTKQFFEGDQVIEFDFMPLRENGLSLLCLQAAGMQGEDFMCDYPLRLDGSMSLVFGENVRLYHWEYFREMDDTRNDVASSALIKQPWQHPLAYQCLTDRLACGQWHRLQYVQEGNRLRGSIDGQLLFDVLDEPFGGHGPVFRGGRLGIRLMWKTDIRFRNLHILSKGGAL